MNDKENRNIIQDFFDKRKEKINSIVKYASNQNDVYRVITSENDYSLKIFSKDTITDKEEFNYRLEQYKYAEILKNNGINVILPQKINNQYIIKYGEVYISLSNTFKNDRKVNIPNLVKLFSSIHLDSLKLNLKSHYRNINLKDIVELEELINKSNYWVQNGDNLVISQNDFKPLNILWKNKQPHLIDFDAVGYSNRCASLIEFAINFSFKNKYFNYYKMKKIFKEYFRKNSKENFEMAFHLALNGKLSWLEYLISINNKKEVKSMLEYLKNVYNKKEKIKKLYNNA